MFLLVSSLLLEPEIVKLGKNSLFEILKSSSETFKFSLSAFNSGLFLYASNRASYKDIACA